LLADLVFLLAVFYSNRFSGINPKEYYSQLDTMPDLEEARRQVMRLVGPETLLIGHGLENDLRALRLSELHSLKFT